MQGSVSEERPTTAGEFEAGEDRDGRYPTSLLHLMPAVTFGLRAAALAGLIVPAGAVAVGLTGVFDDGLGTAHTTCSRGHTDIS
jgi:hypothetical protein